MVLSAFKKRIKLLIFLLLLWACFRYLWDDYHRALAPRREKLPSDSGHCIRLRSSLSDRRALAGDARNISAVTLVTAYYSVTSKHTAQDYLRWVALFLLRVKHPLVIYTDCWTASKGQRLQSIIQYRHRKFPGATLIKFLDLDSTLLATRFAKVMRHQVSHDPEVMSFPGYLLYKLGLGSESFGHNYWLYMVWLMKFEALHDAVSTNLFGSAWFMWTDIGSMRQPAHLFYDWPSLSRLQQVPKDRVLVSLVSSFPDSVDMHHAQTAPTDLSTWPGRDHVDLIDTDHIAAGFIAFSAEENIYATVYAAITETYKRLASAGHLIVKEQTVLNAAFLLHRHLFALVPSVGDDSDDKWFYMHDWLAAPGERMKEGPVSHLLLPQ